MKRNLFLLIPYICLCFFIGELRCQEVVSSSGNFAQNSSGMISFTLGELIINTHSNENKTITQGFQQTKLILTAIKEVDNIGFSINAFPNPASDRIKIEISKSKTEVLEYLLIDYNGKVLTRGKIENGEAIIPIELLVPGTYFIKVLKENREMKTMKVVKL